MAKVYMVRVLAVVGNSAAQYDAIFGADVKQADEVTQVVEEILSGTEAVQQLPLCIAHEGGRFTVRAQDVRGVQLMIGEAQPKGLVVN